MDALQGSHYFTLQISTLQISTLHTSHYKSLPFHNLFRVDEPFLAKSVPLTNLTWTGVDLIWDDACEEAFQVLKTVLMTTPVLIYLTQNRQFVLVTDVRDCRIGAVLEQ